MYDVTTLKPMRPFVKWFSDEVDCVGLNAEAHFRRNLRKPRSSLIRAVVSRDLHPGTGW